MRPHFIALGTDPLIEWMFMLVVIIACFLIYFKTKEFYELSGHKGIKYFRQSFLFFGITYIASLFMKIFGSHFRMPCFDPAIPFIPKIVVAIGMYASTATFIYLLLTVLWKKLDKTIISSNYFVHGLSLMVASISFLGKIPLTFFFFQLVFFLLFLFIVSFNKATFNKKQKPILIFTYLLIFGHWIIILFLDSFSLLFPMLGSFIYIVTLCFFIVLLDRFWLHFSQQNSNEKTRKTSSHKRYTKDSKRK